MFDTRIYMYDNGTGIEFPKKIDVFPVNILLGNTINDIHESAGECQLFCIATHIPDEDFIVPDKDSKEILDSILRFGNKKYKVSVRETSMWYNKKAYKNLIITDSVRLTPEDLKVILEMYITKSAKEKSTIKPVMMYVVVNTRNSEEVIRTPNYDEAIRICNKTPCTVITDREGNLLYKTKFGKVVSSSRNPSMRMKAFNKNSNGLFKIKIN